MFKISTREYLQFDPAKRRLTKKFNRKNSISAFGETTLLKLRSVNLDLLQEALICYSILFGESSEIVSDPVPVSTENPSSSAINQQNI